VIVWVNSVMTMFGQMEPFYLLWNGGILQLQEGRRGETTGSRLFSRDYDDGFYFRDSR